jgi:hypothetical protein
MLQGACEYPEDPPLRTPPLERSVNGAGASPAIGIVTSAVVLPIVCLQHDVVRYLPGIPVTL